MHIYYMHVSVYLYIRCLYIYSMHINVYLYIIHVTHTHTHICIEYVIYNLLCVGANIYTYKRV